jgi:mRNA-degrading endonuclease RelE of RelBE toxin-antitoxin system
MNSRKNWALQIDPRVFKELRKLPHKDSGRILFTIENIPTDPFYGDVQKMKKEKNVWRRRAGSYRIFYELIPSSGSIHVFHVERRTSKTY